jgi:hypothetical protein
MSRTPDPWRDDVRAPRRWVTAVLAILVGWSLVSGVVWLGYCLAKLF